jgi:hypothetical protein
MTSQGQSYDYVRLRRRSLLLFVLGGVIPALCSVGTTVYAARHPHSWFVAVLPVLLVAAPLPLWLRLRAAAAHAPARLQVAQVAGRPAFAVPPAPWSAGPLAANCVIIGVGVIWGNALWLILATGQTGVRALLVLAALALSVPITACAYPLLATRWRVVLRPTDIRVPRLLVGHRSFGWDRLVPGRVALDTQIYLGTRPTGWFAFHPGVAAVHPEFLAEVIAYYLEHPEFRAEIGAPREQDRMIRAMLRERQPLPSKL